MTDAELDREVMRHRAVAKAWFKWYLTTRHGLVRLFTIVLCYGALIAAMILAARWR